MAFGINLGGSTGSSKSKTEGQKQLTGTQSTKTTGQNTSQQKSTGTSQQTGQANTSFWTQPQQDVANQVGQLLLGQLQGGALTQPSQAEQNALNQLNQYTAGSYQDVFDPTATNALYKSIENQTLQDILPKATQTIAKQANLGGMLNSGTGLKMQLENRNQVVNDLSNTLAQLKYADEQAKREAALTDPMQRIAAGLQYGGTGRQITTNTLNNILPFLGLQGGSQTQTQQTGQTTQDTQATQNYLENILQQISQLEKYFEKTKGSASQVGGNIGFGLD